MSPYFWRIYNKTKFSNNRNQRQWDSIFKVPEGKKLPNLTILNPNSLSKMKLR